jgi:hypothetical protein
MQAMKMISMKTHSGLSSVESRAVLLTYSSRFRSYYLSKKPTFLEEYSEFLTQLVHCARDQEDPLLHCDAARTSFTGTIAHWLAREPDGVKTS